MTDQTVEPVTQQQETITKQRNPLRVEQGRKLVEYNKCKKEELKHLNEQIAKQDSIDHKPKPDTNTYVYVGSLGVFGLAIGGYLLHSKFKKQEQNLIDVPPPPVPKTSTEPKRDILKCFKNFYHIIYKWLKTIEKIKKERKKKKESVYHGSVISVLPIGYTMLGKTLIKMSPPSLSKFDIEDTVKLVGIVALSDFTKDYLIKQKIIPNNI